MLCTFCHMARLDNEAPCPFCGAPSPLSLRNGYDAAPYGATMPPQAIWSNLGSAPAFPQTPAQVSNQVPVPQALPQTPQAQPLPDRRDESLLPAIYQPPQPSVPFQPGFLPQPLQEPGLEGSAMVPVPAQDLGTFIATLPGGENVTYVPPMYTKPRAIIPRYRAISGLLSVLIVTLLLCSGLAYYAKASGKLTALSQKYGLIPPPNLQPSPTVPLPDPPTKQVTGPAYGIINSATTTARINDQHVAIEQDTVFKPGQIIYLTYSVQQPKTPGIVTIKWYTNGMFYQASPPTPLIKTAINGYTSEEYPQPAEGMVELYWNNQLAIRLYFVVR